MSTPLTSIVRKPNGAAPRLPGPPGRGGANAWIVYLPGGTFRNVKVPLGIEMPRAIVNVIVPPQSAGTSITDVGGIVWPF